MKGAVQRVAFRSVVITQIYIINCGALGNLPSSSIAVTLMTMTAGAVPRRTDWNRAGLFAAPMGMTVRWKNPNRVEKRSCPESLDGTVTKRKRTVASCYDQYNTVDAGP